jgi:DNA (cytosine-5)-methyltransferase 1
MKKVKRPVAVDIFSGCGGLTVGLKKAGFKVIGAVDNDSIAVKTYKANHPEVEVWGEDISGINTLGLKRKLHLRSGELDLLAGCPPCQGFSSMRTLNGNRRVIDPRNNLINEFLRFVKDLKPKAVMLENVPGLAKDHRFRIFRRELKALGYQGNYKILNAKYYRVPQRRRRLIYLAGLDREVKFARPITKIKTVRQAIGKLPKAGKSGDPVHDTTEKRSPKVVSLISRIPKDGGSRTDLPKRSQLKCHKRLDGFKDVYGRMAWNDLSPTITSGFFNPSKGRFLHPTENRAVTLREAALLQGFPRWYKFPVHENKTANALMIGNALPPPFIAAHARMVLKAINPKIKDKGGVMERKEQ